MATFALIAEHPPHLCPTSNGKTREILKQGASQIPQLANQLGVAPSPAVQSVHGRLLGEGATRSA